MYRPDAAVGRSRPAVAVLGLRRLRSAGIDPRRRPLLEVGPDAFLVARDAHGGPGHGDTKLSHPLAVAELLSARGFDERR